MTNTFNPASLTDDQLAAAANEYFQRAMRRVEGIKGSVTLFQHAWAFGDRSKYEISHSFEIDKVKLEGGNLFELAEKHRAIAGIPVTPPVSVTPLLTAPIPPEPVYAEFSEVENTPKPQYDSTLNDDVPF
jgi:hypothetical protein